jgi:hypothetical protein
MKVEVFYKKKLNTDYAIGKPLDTKLDEDEYVSVWAGDMNEIDSAAALDKIFEWFNIGMGVEFAGRKAKSGATDHSSLSVGDVVKCNDEMFVAAMIGWEEAEWK